MKTFDINVSEVKGGLNANIAVETVKVLMKFTDDVEILTKEATVDAKSILGVISLAGHKDDTITFRVRGNNAAEIESELRKVFK